MSIWEPGFYTAEQIGVLNAEYRKLQTTGHASEAYRLEIAVTNKTPFEDIDVKQSPVRGTAEIHPEVKVNLDEAPDMPQRTGPTGTSQAWREFAAAVSDVEEEILDNLGRNEIIDLLIDKGIIEDE